MGILPQQQLPAYRLLLAVSQQPHAVMELPLFTASNVLLTLALITPGAFYLSQAFTYVGRPLSCAPYNSQPTLRASLRAFPHLQPLLPISTSSASPKSTDCHNSDVRFKFSLFFKAPMLSFLFMLFKTHFCLLLHTSTSTVIDG